MAPWTHRTGWLLGGVLALVATPATVFGQGNTFNPYGNSGYPDYREFTTPMYSNNPALPGQARIQSQPVVEGSARGANQFEQYLDRLDDPGVFGRETTRPRAAAPGMPYYRSFRQYDEQYKRVYTPYNTKAESDFSKRLRDREKRYDEAMREPDATKRAKMLRQIAAESAQDDRPRATAKGSATSAIRPRAKAAPSTTTTAPRAGAAAGTSEAAPAATTPRPTPGSVSPVPYPAGLDPTLLPPGSTTRPRPTTSAPTTSPAPTARPATPPAG